MSLGNEGKTPEIRHHAPTNKEQAELVVVKTEFTTFSVLSQQVKHTAFFH